MRFARNDARETFRVTAVVLLVFPNPAATGLAALISAADLPAVLAVVAGGVLLGWLLLFAARRQDRKNWIYQRAPMLPVRSLSTHDDAWIRGVVRESAPLRCPWFGTACVYYSYRIERKVTRVYRDSKGRTRTQTYWTTEYTESDVMRFWLADREAAILVCAERADFKHLPGTGTDYQGFGRRHSAVLLPVEQHVSVLGVKMDDGSYAPYREVPLLVTTKEPAHFLRGADRAEWWLRLGGYVVFFATGFVAMVVEAQRSHAQPNWWLGIGLAFGLLVPVWAISSYNRLVRLEHQVEASWRQIDVDLGVRHAVIPQLVAVVKGYGDHERELFERIARMRSGGTRGDKIASEKDQRLVSAGLLALRERYPKLAADEQYQSLHDKLWALEEKIAASRDFYNRIANEWNDLVQGVPTNLVAAVCGYGPREYFSA